MKRTPILLTAARSTKPDTLKCKYMDGKRLSHRLCHRQGRCAGCPTEEFALAHSPQS